MLSTRLLPECTKAMLLAWKDTTREALRASFQVAFLLSHLWTLAPFLFEQDKLCIYSRIEENFKKKEFLKILLGETKTTKNIRMDFK